MEIMAVQMISDAAAISTENGAAVNVSFSNVKDYSQMVVFKKSKQEGDQNISLRDSNQLQVHSSSRTIPHVVF